MERIRAGASTTPGRMWVVSLAVLAAIVLVWALASYAVGRRGQGINTVGSDVEPVIVISQNIQSLMSGADALAANSFLAGGLEPPIQRVRYQQDISQAQDNLTMAAQAGGQAAAAINAIRTLAEQDPVYTGLVETARANNRQLFPVGAGYLNRAHTVLTGTVIPAAQTLHDESLVRLNAGYSTASSSLATVSVLVAALILLVVLVVAQVFLRRQTNRVLNVGLLGATALSVGLVVWTLLSLLSQGHQVSAAQDRADTLNVLSQARVTAFRAKSDESFALIARGNGAAQYTDFVAAVAQLGSTTTGKGLLGEAASRANSADEQTALAQATTALQAYLTAHDHIHTLDTSGQSTQAIAAALASGSGSSNQAFDTLDSSLTSARSQVQKEFDGHISDARSRLAGLAIGLTIGFLVSALLVIYGFQLRIREYR